MDNRCAAGPAPEEESLPDEAVFTPVSLPRRKRPIGGAVIALLVGGLAVVGVLGSREHAALAGSHAKPPVAAAPGSEAFREAPWRSRPGTGEPATAALLAIDARMAGRRLFLSGEVFTPDAFIVFVTIGDLDDNTLEVRSVDMPGGSTAFRLGANDRFDLTFEMDAWPTAAAWATATAFDRTGYPIESVRQALGAESGGERLPIVTGAGGMPFPVRLETPGTETIPVTGNSITVQATLRIHADSVRVGLQTMDFGVLDSTVVATSNIDGGVRPVHAPTIDVELALPTPRPTGEWLWVIVTAYDAAGDPLGSVRRLVTIGALAD